MRDDYREFNALPPGEGGEGAEAAPNPIKLVHRALRGRYLIAIALGVALAAPLAFVGFNALPPLYQSQALLQIRARIETTLYPIEEVIPAFESYKQTQATFLRSRRTLDMASESLARQLPDRWPAGPEGASKLDSGLAVIVPRSGEVLHVSFIHEDPVVAKQATDAVLNAYMSLFGEGSGVTRTQTERDLDDEVRRLQRLINESNNRVQRLSQRYGTSDLARMHQQKVDQLAQFNAYVGQLEFALASARTVAGESDPENGASSRPNRIEDFPLDMLAEADPQQTGEMVTQLRLLRRELDTRRLRLGENHRDVRSVQRRIQILEQQLQDRVGELQGRLDIDNLAAAGPDNGLGAGVLSGRGNAAQLEAQLEDAARRRDLLRTEVNDLNNTRNEIESERNSIRSAESLLENNQVRLQMLRAESRNADIARVVIAQPGDTPLRPSTDRRLPLAAAGAMGGFGLGVGLIGLIGFLRTGVRYIDDFEPFIRRAPLIGVIPDLDSDEGDGSAALSIHHLRNLLHVARVRSGGGPRVYTLTSPTSGDGKTSLTYALGLSFAAVGQRTLVIDADLVASGLTRQLDLDGQPGLWEALEEGAQVDDMIHPTTSPTLFAMPIGAEKDPEPERLGGDRLAHVLDAARGRFDIVLIDTGPLLGSLDASLAASASDQVILTVASGQKLGLIRAALARLDSLHASCAGLVFNRASWDDLKGSISPASLNSWSIRSIDPRGESNQSSEQSRRTRRRLATAASTRGLERETSEPTA
ncbi:MAG: hypothetical protein EA378_07785 [Phycisphaerales bacterium]|nr:MAG: hypothetical protein EA378_07785 [Phycisphaerales bacterium]